jgi:hypothetical protein
VALTVVITAARDDVPVAAYCETCQARWPQDDETFEQFAAAHQHRRYDHPSGWRP